MQFKSVFLLSLLLVVGNNAYAGEPTPKQPDIKFDYQAGVVISIDRAKLAKQGITISDTIDAVKLFLEKQESFYLSELNAIKIGGTEDHPCKLGDFAKIDIKLKRMNRENK